MALAADWDEIRRGVLLNILFGAAVTLSVIVFRAEFDFRRPTSGVYAFLVAVVTLLLIFFYWRQQRSRPGKGG